MTLEFITRRAAGNYLKHYGFHQIGLSYAYSNGSYMAYAQTYQSRNKLIKTRVDFHPLTTMLTLPEIKHKIEDAYYAIKENEIKAG